MITKKKICVVLAVAVAVAVYVAVVYCNVDFMVSFVFYFCFFTTTATVQVVKVMVENAVNANKDRTLRRRALDKSEAPRRVGKCASAYTVCS